jgi:hypothetical protein
MCKSFVLPSFFSHFTFVSRLHPHRSSLLYALFSLRLQITISDFPDICCEANDVTERGNARKNTKATGRSEKSRIADGKGQKEMKGG